MQYLSDIHTSKRYGVSRATVWRWAQHQTNDFPKPHKINGATRWKLSEIEAWEADQEGRKQ